jgi:hypothetical protein
MMNLWETGGDGVDGQTFKQKSTQTTWIHNNPFCVCKEYYISWQCVS